MSQEEKTNYDLMYGDPERAAAQLAIEIVSAMIEALPNPLAGATGSEDEIQRRLDAWARWQARLVARTDGAIREWAREFLGAQPGEPPKSPAAYAEMVHEHAEAHPS